MIQIDNCDLPIHVAEKIIEGTKDVPTSMLDKVVHKAFIGKEIGKTVSRNMFDLEEIKEIADYLMVYYQVHSNGATKLHEESEEQKRDIKEELCQEFKKELQAAVYQKLNEINHYVCGCDSPFTYKQKGHVQGYLNCISEELEI